MQHEWSGALPYSGAAGKLLPGWLAGENSLRFISGFKLK
jgi:hypothetical protein